MPRILAQPDLAKLTAAWADLKQPFPLAFDLMLHAGLRISEVLNTCWSELIHNGETKSALLLTSLDTKNHRERTIPITAALAPSIQLTWTSFAVPAHFHPIDFVFAPNAKTGPFSSRTLQRLLAKTSNAAIGQSVNPHMLRHTFATELLAVTNLPIVQQALGHRRISTTAIYTHPSLSQVAAGMSKMFTS